MTTFYKLAHAECRLNGSVQIENQKSSNPIRWKPMNWPKTIDKHWIVQKSFMLTYLRNKTIFLFVAPTDDFRKSFFFGKCNSDRNIPEHPFFMTFQFMRIRKLYETLNKINGKLSAYFKYRKHKILC